MWCRDKFGEEILILFLVTDLFKDLEYMTFT